MYRIRLRIESVKTRRREMILAKRRNYELKRENWAKQRNWALKLKKFIEMKKYLRENCIPLFWKLFERIYYFSIVATILIILKFILYISNPIENYISEKITTILFCFFVLIIVIRFILKKYLTSKHLIWEMRINIIDFKRNKIINKKINSNSKPQLATPHIANC